MARFGTFLTYAELAQRCGERTYRSRRLDVALNEGAVPRPPQELVLSSGSVLRHFALLSIAFTKPFLASMAFAVNKLWL